MRIYKLIPASIIVFLACVKNGPTGNEEAGTATDVNSSIYGSILYEGEEYTSPVKVELYLTGADEHSMAKFPAKTNPIEVVNTESGTYEFDSLKAGEYAIKIFFHDTNLIGEESAIRLGANQAKEVNIVVINIINQIFNIHIDSSKNVNINNIYIINGDINEIDKGKYLLEFVEGEDQVVEIEIDEDGVRRKIEMKIIKNQDGTYSLIPVEENVPIDITSETAVIPPQKGDSPEAPMPDSLGPSISLVHPSWKDTVVFAADIRIEVQADDSSGVESVKINGEEASLSEGKYTQTLKLSSGENKIVVMAEDESAYQNQSADTLKITYDPPPDAVTLFPPTHMTGKGMTITWSQNQNTDFKAYKIFFSTDSAVSNSDSLEYEEKIREDTVFHFSGLMPHRTYYVKVYVFDNYSGTGSNAVSAFLNTAPVFEAVDGQSLNENELLSFSISATDAEGDNLTYSMLAPPVGDGRPAFDSSTQKFSWTPAYTDAGEYVAKFEVTDNAQVPGRDTLSVDITVKNFNGDSLVVRNLLDENGFSSVAVDTNICKYANERITQLYLDSNRISGQLSSLPASIQNLTKLKVLHLSENKLTSLPEEIGSLINLSTLYVFSNQLSSLPLTIGNLTRLQFLVVYANKLSSLPAEIKTLTELRTLDLNGNELTNLPSEIGNLTELENLGLGSNKLTNLPSEIGNLKELRTLSLDGNKLTSLPPELGNLSNLRRLDICDVEFTEFPDAIFKLTSLTDLIMRNNKFKIIPKEIGNLSNLVFLYTPVQEFTELPAEIGNLSKLERLILSNGYLTSLPAEIGNLSALTELYVYENQLSSLSIEIVNLTNLTVLDVNNNNLCNLSETVKTWINTYSSKSDWESTQSCLSTPTLQNSYLTDTRDNKQY